MTTKQNTARLSSDSTGNSWWLITGLGAIAALFLLQGVIDTVSTRRADAQSRQVAQDAVASVEALTGLIRIVDQQRIALSGYLFAERGVPNPEATTQVNREVAVLGANLGRAIQAYRPLATAPGEQALWPRVRQRLERYERGTLEVLDLARQEDYAQARAHFVALRHDYSASNRGLLELLSLNRTAAATALTDLASLQQDTEQLQWGVRLAGLLGLLILGFFGVRRVEHYERRLAAHARDLELRNEELDAFAGRVAHDLKNALVPIIMSHALLRRSVERPSEVLEVADRTERYSRKASDIIEALLTFSRGGQPQREHEAAALSAVVNDVVEELSPTAAELGVNLDTGGLGEFEVQCDRELLHVVLANLCGNAIKFLAGRPVRRVRITARREGADCRIEIEDTGPGIPREEQEKIFRPFFRLRQTAAEGTGLGLATVHRILDAHGGRARVDSIVGQGSTFTVWLPLAAPQRPEHAAPSA